MLQVKPAPPHSVEARCHDGAGFDTQIVIAYSAHSCIPWRRSAMLANIRFEK
jgi:hypothetical protein